MQNKIFGWCFQNIETKVLEPYEQYDQYDGGHGIYNTKKALLDNVWNKAPKGYTPIRVEIILKKKTNEKRNKNQ